MKDLMTFVSVEWSKIQNIGRFLSTEKYEKMSKIWLYKKLYKFDTDKDIPLKNMMRQFKAASKLC